jgi:DMSO/TMAO reductase YedYZ molybdopterin-dependent catalytic subunit
MCWTGARVLCRARTWRGTAVLVVFRGGDAAWVTPADGHVTWAETARMPERMRPWVALTWNETRNLPQTKLSDHVAIVRLKRAFEENGKWEKASTG